MKKDDTCREFPACKLLKELIQVEKKIGEVRLLVFEVQLFSRNVP